ncbi:hypothetical protein B0H13DRAFT_2550536 [Mycena leptocephala]|nr:hypothetical protein B0H13DRAFT_2550536 [Mycena leptocephala]
MPISLRRTLTRRDGILILVGAAFMHFFDVFSPLDSAPHAIVIDTAPRPQALVDLHHTETTTLVQSTTTTVLAEPSADPSFSPLDLALDSEEFPSTDPTSFIPLERTLDSGLLSTSIVAHAPGWTLFRNLYMSNGTFFIVSDTPSDFPKIRLMTSNPLPAENTPRNIAMREPTPYSMAFLASADARLRWGDDGRLGKRNRVLTVDGNTVLVNEPTQFLRHYYHLVAELFFGVQAFWHGAFSAPSSDPDRDYIVRPHPSPPPIHRVIFARSNADGWRDNPGFNSYFMRAAFPGTTIEVEDDWEDRVEITYDGDRAWHFPLLLLTDRSAAHRGAICGSQTQRIAAEAVEFMRSKRQLVGERVGGWWEPVRSALLQFAGADVALPQSTEQQVVLGRDIDPKLPMPAKIVITYISRQSAGQRKLTPESHELAWRKGWELNVVEAEKLTRDEQLRIIGRTTILLGVHGNGLTHLVFMQPTRVSAVIEMFYPGGFAHDYQWTSRALGMKHFAVWNDTYRSEGIGEGKPRVDYPNGFQGNYIPAHGPALAQLIEDRIEERL